MSFTLFVSRKFIADKNAAKGYSLFTNISIAGVAIGVMALIIALSIIQGFEEVITEKLTSFDSHLQVNGASYLNIKRSKKDEARIKAIAGKSLVNVNPYITRLAIFSHGRQKEGVSVKGVMEDYFSSKSDIRIVSGDLNISKEKVNGKDRIFIGKKLADKLFLSSGDSLTLFALKNDAMPSITNMPNIQKFIVGGIYESGMAKYDDNFAYVHLENADSLFSMHGYINGYEIKLNDLKVVDSLRSELEANMSFSAFVSTYKYNNQQIFNWIDLQRKPIPIVLGLIILVAVFNVISTLLLIIMDKTEAIGTLKAMGASDIDIIKIFLFRGLYISFWGILIGSTISLAVIVLQMKFGIISLPSSVYFLSKVPMVLKAWIFLLVSGVAVVLSIIVSILPSYIASKIKPVQTLRFR